jgi:hypothetical protein
MVVYRDAFGAWWQALIVIALQLGGSGFAMVGYLVTINELLDDDGDRATLAPAWSCIFVFALLSLCLTALMDAVRVREIDAWGGFLWALELTATRVLLLSTVLPILAVAFVIYANVCCDGGYLL